MAPNYDSLDQSRTEHLPTWLAAVPAILLGILAGLILHAFLQSRIPNPESPSLNRESPSLNRESPRLNRQTAIPIPNPNSLS